MTARQPRSCAAAPPSTTVAPCPRSVSPSRPPPSTAQPPLGRQRSGPAAIILSRARRRHAATPGSSTIGPRSDHLVTRPSTPRSHPWVVNDRAPQRSSCHAPVDATQSDAVDGGPRENRAAAVDGTRHSNGLGGCQRSGRAAAPASTTGALAATAFVRSCSAVRSNRVCAQLLRRPRPGISQQPRLCAASPPSTTGDLAATAFVRSCSAAHNEGSSGPPDKWLGEGVAGTCASQRDVTVAAMTPVVGGAAAHKRGCCEISSRGRRSSCAQTRWL